MPEPTNPNSPPAPAAQPPATPPAPAATPAAVPPAGTLTLTSEQLKERLDRAREGATKDTLTAMGVENIEDGKTGLAEAKKIREAAMTETERLRTQNEELAPKAQRTAQLEKVIADRVAVELAGLTEMQRVAVKASAGDDPARQLQIIDALKPTWATQAAAPAAPPPATAPTPPKPNPGNTTPETPSPPTGEQGTAPDHLAQYELLESKNPMKAAQYRLQNSAAISAAQAKKRAAT